MEKFYIFDATRSDYVNGTGEGVTLSDHINYLSSTKSCAIDALDVADSQSDLNAMIKYLSTPVYVFNNEFDYVGSFNRPDCVPARINGSFDILGKTHRCIDLFIDIEGQEQVIKGFIVFSDDVTTCGRTYPVLLNLLNVCFDGLNDFDFDIAEEAIFQSISDGEISCFYDDFSYKLYDLM